MFLLLKLFLFFFQLVCVSRSSGSCKIENPSKNHGENKKQKHTRHIKFTQTRQASKSIKGQRVPTTNSQNKTQVGQEFTVSPVSFLSGLKHLLTLLNFKQPQKTTEKHSGTTNHTNNKIQPEFQAPV